MKITDLDYIAVFGTTYLHKTPAKIKLIVLAVLMAVILSSLNLLIDKKIL